ncbi:MAG: hypothetical protein H7Z17_06420 [Fuerstia sp.]|nr:hypothetical protein [Fuerstiella sp.]
MRVSILSLLALVSVFGSSVFAFDAKQILVSPRTSDRDANLVVANAETAIARGDYQIGLDSLGTQLKKTPNDARLWCFLAICHEKLGNQESANAALRITSVLRHRNPGLESSFHRSLERVQGPFRIRIEASLKDMRHLTTPGEVPEILSAALEQIEKSSSKAIAEHQILSEPLPVTVAADTLNSANVALELSIQTPAIADATSEHAEEISPEVTAERPTLDEPMTVTVAVDALTPTNEVLEPSIQSLLNAEESVIGNVFLTPVEEFREKLLTAILVAQVANTEQASNQERRPLSEKDLRQAVAQLLTETQTVDGKLGPIIEAVWQKNGGKDIPRLAKDESKKAAADLAIKISNGIGFRVEPPTLTWTISGFSNDVAKDRDDLFSLVEFYLNNAAVEPPAEFTANIKKNLKIVAPSPLPQDPIAKISVGTMSAVFVGDEVGFDGSGSITSTNSKYEWDFDFDEATFDVDVTGITASRKFAAPKVYTVALRVTDGAGRFNVAKVKVEVRAKNVIDNAGGHEPPQTMTCVMVNCVRCCRNFCICQCNCVSQCNFVMTIFCQQTVCATTCQQTVCATTCCQQTHRFSRLRNRRLRCR